MSEINTIQGVLSDYSGSGIDFFPINHASFVIQNEDITIYVDPAGIPGSFKDFAAPDIILLTDIHSDHFDSALINQLKQKATIVVGPKAVVADLGFGDIIGNSQTKQYRKITVEAIAMYNLTPQRRKFHPKGRGNGYMLTLNGNRIYISGDTEDVPEMRRLKNVDYAFLCMNLPYTMDVEQAASATLDFRPKVVIPYHYRDAGGLSDIEKFRELVSVDPEINVVLLKWY